MVSKRFAALGVPVIDADELAHTLSKRGQPAFDEIVALFGDGVVGKDGELDRRRLREIVFEDPERRRALEGILHPRIRAKMRRRAAALDAPYAILSIPLLLESGQAGTVDRVLVVDAPDEMRIAWIKSRSGLSEVEIMRIIEAQASRETRLAAADDVIVNDGTLEELQGKIDVVAGRYAELAAGR